MPNGPIYYTISKLICGLWYLNAVEYVKKFTAFIYKSRNPDKPNDDRTGENFGIDLFIILKWILISVLIVCKIDSYISLLVTYYLIAANTYSYFYYHVWDERAFADMSVERSKRRFVNFLISIAFYIYCYAYIYYVHVPCEILWPDHNVDFINSAYLSLATAFTLTYGGFAPETQFVRVLFASELINTFVFLTIIVSNSIPTKN